MHFVITHHQPAQKLKKSPRSRTSGAVIDVVEGQVILQTLPQALDTLLGYSQRPRNDFKQVNDLTW